MADRDGGITAGPPVRLGGRRAGDPVRTGWDGFDEAQPVVLDDLADVDTPAGALGVLTRAATGEPAQFRPISHHHDQVVAVEQWLISHALPFTPSGIQIVGDQGQRIYPRRVVHTPGQTRIEFAYPVAGYADLS